MTDPATPVSALTDEELAKYIKIHRSSKMNEDEYIFLCECTDGRLLATIATLQAERDGLREALSPFAMLGRSSAFAGDGYVRFRNDTDKGGVVKMECFRRAAAAYSPEVSP